MNIRLVLMTVVGLTVAFGLGGCQTVSQADYDAAIDENTQLRERIATLQDNVRQANERQSGTAGEIQRLRDENSALRAQAAATPSPRGNSGFESIQGVDVAYRDGGEIVVGVAGDVLFAAGSVTLRTDAKKSLDEVAGVLESRYAGNAVRVEGHTDSDPIRKSKWKSNEQLSSERALAVEAYLVSKGVDGNRTYSAAFGSSRPKGTKKDSRRVEIVILGNN